VFGLNSSILSGSTSAPTNGNVRRSAKGRTT